MIPVVNLYGVFEEGDHAYEKYLAGCAGDIAHMIDEGKDIETVYLNGGKPRDDQKSSEAKSCENVFRKLLDDVGANEVKIELVEDGSNTPQNFHFAIKKATEKKNTCRNMLFYSDQLHNPKAIGIGLWVGLYHNLVSCPLSLFRKPFVKVSNKYADRRDFHSRNTKLFQYIQAVLFWICPLLIWWQIAKPAQKSKLQQDLIVKTGVIKDWDGRNTPKIILLCYTGIRLFMRLMISVF